jgi:phosphatidylinositol glycan class B
MSLGAIALPAVLLVAFAIRIWVFWTQPSIIFVDETFQYFEQGHRLAFGTGVVPWEFVDGIRSWLLPGVIAGIMRLTALLGDDPLLYVRLTRSLCAALSLVVVFVGFRVGQRQFGLPGAIAAGGFCAIWYSLIYFAPVVMTEVIAAHVAIAAIYMDQAGAAGDNPDRRRLLTVGALMGLAACLRFQYAPPLLAAALFQHRLYWAHWRFLLLGGLAVVVPVGGMLDAITLGAPFQSIWLNFTRNTIDHVSSGMGTEGTSYYLAYLVVMLGTAAGPAAALLILGAVRMPALAIAAAVTLLLHSLVPHKEVRFIYLTIAVAPILIGLGSAWLIDRLAHDRRSVTAGAATLFLLLGALVSSHTGTGPLGWRSQAVRASVQATLAAHAEPAMCGLLVRDVWFWRSGGYTYLNRDVPLWFGYYDPNLKLPHTDRPEIVRVMRDGHEVPQFTLDRVGANTRRFSHMIADQGWQEPGYAQVACFDDVNRADDEPPLCLYRRPGDCAAD